MMRLAPVVDADFSRGLADSRDRNALSQDQFERETRRVLR